MDSGVLTHTYLIQLYPQAYGARQGTQKKQEKNDMDASNSHSEARNGMVRSGAVQYGTVRGVVWCRAVWCATTRPGPGGDRIALHGTVQLSFSTHSTCVRSTRYSSSLKSSTARTLAISSSPAMGRTCNK